MRFFWSNTFFLLAAFLAKAADVTLLLPADTAGFQNSRRAVLQWQPEREDLVSYQVYLGLAPDALVFLADSGTNTYAMTGELEKGCTYYWQVVGANNLLETFPSDVWSFTTGDPEIRSYRFVPSANPDAFDTEMDAALVETNRTLDLAKTALLVIDFWRGPYCPDAPDCPDVPEHHAQTNLLNLIRLARNHGITVVHLPHDYPITPDLSPMPWEPVWDFSGLDQYLADNGITTLLYAGFATAECVTLSRTNSIYRLGHRADYDILLVKDCTFSPFWHYQWAVNGVESIYASTLLDDLATAMSEPAASIPLDIPDTSWPPMPEIDQTFVEDLWPERTALVVVNAWSDHPNDGWRERMSVNNTNNIRPLIAFARAAGMPVVHVPNGRPIEPSCAPAPDEFVADTHDALLAHLEELSVQTLVFAGNFVNDTAMFPAVNPWLLTMYNGGDGLQQYYSYLLEDCIICYESPASLAETRFKTVFLERAVCYGPGINLVSQAALLRDAVSLPVTNLNATQGSLTNTITVTWSPIPGALNYRVLRGTTDDLDATLPVGETTDCRFDDPNAVPGLIHYYWIVADTPWGPGATSGAASGYRGLAPPATLMASTGAYRDRISLTWAPVAGANDYEVFCGGDDVFTAALSLGTTAGTNFNDYSAPMSMHQTYWVVARSAMTQSAPCEPATGWCRSPTATGTSSLDAFGDGKAALVLYDESRGLWALLGSDNSTRLLAWGGPDMVPVPGDYDADGRADLAVYHEPSGLWYIRNADNSILAWAEPWGGPGLQPVPGDFDNDGQSDLAVYEQASGLWYVTALPNPHTQTPAPDLLAWGLHWGGPGMTPAPGDYDGDGKSDYAVYGADSGYWYILNADRLILAWAIPLGGPEYTPVWGDYSGDGVSDLAVYHHTSGLWYIVDMNAQLVLWGEPWGAQGMVPVPGDYSGDGASDLAVYDLASGLWYIRTVDGQIIRFATPFGGGSFQPAFSPN